MQIVFMIKDDGLHALLLAVVNLRVNLYWLLTATRITIKRDVSLYQAG